MDGINPRPTSRDPPIRTAGAETSPSGKSTHNERGMTCGMGRSGGFMTMAVIAVALVIVASLSSGWIGRLSASFGVISLLLLLPALAICVGMTWMMMRRSNGQSTKARNRDRRP